MINLPLITPVPKNIQWLDTIVRSFVDRHINLRGYSFGEPSNSVSEVLPYPYCRLVPTRTRILSNDRAQKSGYSVIEMEVEVSVSDKLRADQLNYVNTISDVNEIMMSLIGELTDHEYYIKNKVSLIGDISIENDWEVNDDIVNRATATLTFRWPFTYNSCNIPVEAINVVPSLYVQQGYVQTGYI